MGKLGAQRTLSLAETHTAKNVNPRSLASEPCCYPPYAAASEDGHSSVSLGPTLCQQLREALLYAQATDRKKISRFTIPSGSGLVGKMGV